MYRLWNSVKIATYVLIQILRHSCSVDDLVSLETNSHSIIISGRRDKLKLLLSLSKTAFVHFEFLMIKKHKLGNAFS